MQSANPVVWMLLRKARRNGEATATYLQKSHNTRSLSYFNNCSTYLISDSVAVRPKGGEFCFCIPYLRAIKVQIVQLKPIDFYND